LHCGGGRGRAGTIVARLLVELGMGPEVAIKAVRDARSPFAIETAEQEAHVRMPPGNRSRGGVNERRPD